MLMAGAGGFLGTCGRFLIGRWCAATFNCTFPIGTFLVNTVGCLIIGISLGLIDKHQPASAAEAALLVTGFCGGFTTFSAFSADILRLMDNGQSSTALFYAIASIACAVIFVWIGRMLAHLTATA